MPKLNMPAITVPQIVAVAGTVIGVLVAFSVHISQNQQDAILALVGAVAVILIHSDRKLRQARLENAHKLPLATMAIQGNHTPQRPSEKLVPQGMNETNTPFTPVPSGNNPTGMED